MMKRLLPILLLLTAILLAVPALAESTEEEWNASCNWIISRDTTLYSASFRDDATTLTDLYEFKPFGSIAAGSRVSIRSSAQGMREIYYWNGGKRSAWVEDTAVSWAGGASAITGGSSTGSGTSGAVKSSGVWKDLDVTLYLSETESKSVTLEVLGTAQSVVFDGTEMLTVNTENLFWETEADEDQRLAVIYAPKTGKATLRASASTKAKSLGQCEAGRIVAVLKVGTVFTRIMYDGKEGCVLTDALILCGAVPPEDFATATLCYKDRTDSSATISVYTEKNANRKIKQWRVGNQVVTLGENGTWTEIEIDGWHGWCKTAYLK
ncbi:MAG: hypothetical protein ACI4MG_01085 [Aristaeellaceae bacterium]